MKQIQPLNQTEHWNDLEPAANSLDSPEGIDYWAILQRGKWVVLASVFLGMAMGYLYYSSAQPVYKSTARILIERRQPALPLQSVEGTSKTINLLQESIKHPLVFASRTIVSLAIEKHQLASLTSFVNENETGNETGVEERMDPAGAIINNLVIEPADKGKIGPIYDITLQGANAQGLPRIIRALVETYRDFLESTLQDVNRDTRELIVQAKDELMRQLATKEAEHETFRQTAPLMWKDGVATNLHQDRQADIETERSQVLIEMSQFKSDLENALAVIESGENLDALKLIAQAAQESKMMANARILSVVRENGELLPLSLQEVELRSRFGPDHPRVKSVERRISHVKDFYRNVLGYDLDDNDRDLNAGGTPRTQKLLDTYLASLSLKLHQRDQRLIYLNELFEEEQRISKDLAVHQARDQHFRNEIVRLQQLFDVVVKSLEEISLVKDYSGHNFQVLAPAEIGFKIAPSAFKIFVITLFLSTLVGFGIAYIIDFSDQSFHTPSEIAKYLELQVVGHIPRFPEHPETVDGSSLSSSLVAVHRPRSALAEAYRTVRTALFFNSRGRQHQVIQVTSPTPGDGKSTLSANLATTIANSGKSVLLLDADFRKPVLHKLFNLSTEVGLASVVDGQVEPKEAYQQVAEIPNLTLMACGPRPDNPSELLSSLSFRENLEYLREQFDFVIVDTPPLLVVSEAGAVAGQVDGVILTLVIDRNTRPVARHACDVLREVGGDIVGVVVNRVSGQKTGYGSYGYGYGYGYQYGYGYGYRYGYGSSSGYGTGYGDDSDEPDKRKLVRTAISSNDASPNGNGQVPGSASTKTPDSSSDAEP